MLPRWSSHSASVSLTDTAHWFRVCQVQACPYSIRSNLSTPIICRFTTSALAGCCRQSSGSSSAWFGPKKPHNAMRLPSFPAASFFLDFSTVLADSFPTVGHWKDIFLQLFYCEWSASHSLLIESLIYLLIWVLVTYFSSNCSRASL